LVAPHLSGLLAMQSDFGHPAGVVVGDYRFGLFPKIWLVARVTQSACEVQGLSVLCLHWHRD